MPVKKPTRSKMPVRVKTHRRRSPNVAPDVRESVQESPSPQTVENTPSTKGWGGTAWIALGLVSMVAAVMLIGVPSRPAKKAAAADTTPASPAALPAPEPAGDIADPPKTAAARTPAAVPAPTSDKPESTPRTLEPSV